MYYIKQKFNIRGEVKEYNIPIASLENNKVVGAKQLMSKGFNADNVKLLGIDKGNLVLPNSENYFDNLLVQDIVIPVITELGDNDIDVTNILYSLTTNFRKQGLPLMIDNGMGFDSELNKYVPTLSNKGIQEYYKSYTISSEELREIEYENKSNKLEAEIASALVQGLITEKDAEAKRSALEEEYSSESDVEYTSYIFKTKNLSNELTFYNLLMYNLYEYFNVFKNAAVNKTGMAGIAKELMEDEDGKFLFAILSTMTAIQGSKVIIPGIIGDITINGNTGRGYMSSNQNIVMLRLSNPQSWTKDAGIIEIMCSCFDMISLMVNSKEFNYKGLDSVNIDLVSENIQKNRGVSTNECSCMESANDLLLLPTYSFTEFRKFIEFMVREEAYEIGKYSDDPSSVVKRMLSLEASNPFYQEMYAFPYTNKDMFSCDYKNSISNDRKWLDLIEGNDKNNDIEFSTNEQTMLTLLLELFVNTLYYEGGTKAIEMGKDAYFEYCMENNISSQLFTEYMTLRCLQVANLNWTHTGIFPCQPVFTWFTKKGFQEYRQGKSRPEGYTFKVSKDYEGDAEGVLLFSSSAVHRCDYSENAIKRVRGEYTLLNALHKASAKDILAPISALIRFARFGDKKPTKIKLTEGMYYQPYDGKVSDISSKAETDKYVVEDGYIGELRAVVFSPVIVEDSDLRDTYNIPSISEELPLFLIYSAPDENFEKKIYKIDIFTMAKLGLKIKGTEKIGGPSVEILNIPIDNDALVYSMSYQGPETTRLKNRFDIQSNSFSYPYSILTTALKMPEISQIFGKEELLPILSDPTLSAEEVPIYSTYYNLTDSDIKSIAELIKYGNTEEFKGLNVGQKVGGCLRHIVSNKLAINGRVKEIVKDDISEAVSDPFAPKEDNQVIANKSTMTSFSGFGEESVKEVVEEPVKEVVEEPVKEVVEEPVKEVVEEPIVTAVEETIKEPTNTEVNEVVDAEFTPVNEEPDESFGSPTAVCEVYTYNNAEYVKAWFDKKPEDSRILDILRTNTFTWMKTKDFWYTKANDFTVRAGQCAVKAYLGDMSIEEAITVSKPVITQATVDDSKAIELQRQIEELKASLAKSNETINQLNSEISMKDNQISELQSKSSNNEEVETLRRELNSIREVALTVTADPLSIGEFDSTKPIADSYGIKMLGRVIGVCEYTDGSAFVSSTPVEGLSVENRTFGRLFIFKLIGTVVKVFNNNKKITVSDDKIMKVIEEQLVMYLDNTSQYSTEVATNIRDLRVELSGINRNSQMGKTMLSVGKLLGFGKDISNLLGGTN